MNINIIMLMCHLYGCGNAKLWQTCSIWMLYDISQSHIQADGCFSIFAKHSTESTHTPTLLTAPSQISRHHHSSHCSFVYNNKSRIDEIYNTRFLCAIWLLQSNELHVMDWGWHDVFSMALFFCIPSIERIVGADVALSTCVYFGYVGMDDGMRFEIPGKKLASLLHKNCNDFLERTDSAKYNAFWSQIYRFLYWSG